MISIITPCFNDSVSLIKNIPELLKCCDNIQGELIIIDDGSTDHLDEKIKMIEHKRLVFIKQENKGVSAARNTGIIHAKYEKILFLDSDDYVNFDLLVSKKDLVHEHDITYWNSKKIYPNGRVTDYIVENSDKDGLIKSLMQRKNNLFIGSFIVSRQIAIDTLFDVSYRYGEDLKFIYEILYRSKSIAKLEDVFLYYMQRPNSSMYIFNARRFDSIDALKSVELGDAYDYYLISSIGYDMKVILNSFIKAHSLFQFRQKLSEYSRMEEVITSVFPGSKYIKLSKFYIYSIIYKVYVKFKK